MTYQEWLKKCKTLPGEQEAFLFMTTEILNITRTELYLNLGKLVPSDVLLRLEEAINAYVRFNKPPQYIVGHTYFYGLKMLVNEHVLIPRKETEELVDCVLEYMATKPGCSIVDVGTGSGCIAIAIKKKRPDVTVCAIDLYHEALLVATSNAKMHQVDISFVQNNLLESMNQTFDIIISNPPYIAKDDYVMDSVKQYEPHSALYSPNDGLYHYQQILHQSQKVLRHGGTIFFEMGDNREKGLTELASKYNKTIDIKKDLQGNNRIMIIR